MTKSYVRTATRTTLKVEANLTQILNFKTNFHTEFETFSGVKLNFFLGWPIGPAKIWFGWPAISLAGPRYFYRFWSADNNYHILRNRN